MRSLFASALAAAACLLQCSAAAAVNTTTSSTPCALLASAQADFYDQNPNAGTSIIDADIAYNCILDIPLQKDYATKLMTSMRPWLELESQMDYLKDPPSGYLWEPIDISKELDRIANNVQKDVYTNHYDFEIDLKTLFLYFHDFHSVFTGKLESAATWYRSFTLVSASADGIELPEVYVSMDLVALDKNNNFRLSGIPAKSISPVTSINGIDVQEFLQTQQLVAYSHDPDSMYNQLFLSIWETTNPGSAPPPSFRVPVFYPGAQTILKFQNGSSVTYPNTAYLACAAADITTGQEYWDTCIAPNVADTTTAIATSTATSTEATKKPRAVSTEAPTLTQIPSHPAPVVMDQAGILSAYYLNDPDYEHLAVLVLRGFASETDGYMESFQAALEAFLEDATKQGKTNLVIDIQGNGGGYTDLGAELLAQLFPNVRPNQKGNFRASPGLDVMLERQGKLVDAANKADNNNLFDALENEALIPYSWQFVMTPEATEFVSFDDYYGPKTISNNGKYTHFFQSNYTNTDPSDDNLISIQITGYGNRTVPASTKPPFDPKNIVILSDGYCGSTCSIAFELLTNMHSIPTIAVGGRPSTGPMQSVGNTKGSQVFNIGALALIYQNFWNDTAPAANRAPAKGTVFENWDSFAVDEGIGQIQARNNYRMGDDSETVLQMVYTAADCRMWYTAEMLVDPTAVWKRTSDIAFDSTRKVFGAGGGPYKSKYCAKDSTGHSSSVTGGLKQGQLGEQDPPDNAYPKYLGWLKEGSEIVQGMSLVTSASPAGSDGGSADDSSSDEPMTETELRAGLTQLKEACTGYKGDKWMFTLICNAIG